MKQRLLVLAISTTLAALPASAAEKAPTVYWMSVATQSGQSFGMGMMDGEEGDGGGMAGAQPGMPQMDWNAMAKEMAAEQVGSALGIQGLGSLFGGGDKKAAQGGGGSFSRSLVLQHLAPGSAEPRADEFVPKGQKMGESLPLTWQATRKMEKETRRPEERHETEKPRGRMLVYWGCSDKVRAGQPMVIDFASGRFDSYGKLFSAYGGLRQRTPGPREGWTYTRWPNEKDSQKVPVDASLLGGHVVKAAYAPEIRFDIPRQQDFMDPVEFTRMKDDLAAPVEMQWKSISTAEGYFAMAMGSAGREDSVIWVSSETAHAGWNLMRYLPTPEVRKLVRDKVVMAPSVTECRIPKGIFKDGAMLQFIAYGTDLDLSHPAKPKNPPKGWQPDWVAKVRLKSTYLGMLGSHSARETAGGRDYTAQERKSPGKKEESPDNPIKGLKGLFGF